MLRYILLIVCWLVSPLYAYETIELQLDSGTDLNINRFEGAGKSLLLWLPSERGFGDAYVPVALDLAVLDYDVWTINLHESYIVPTGRNSLDEVDLDDMLNLLEKIKRQGFDEVFMISSSRGTQLALRMAYLWQQRYPQDMMLRGVVAFSPHLVKGRTEMGSEADYLDIAGYSNLPIYMIQAQRSPKFTRSWEIARRLQRGGSPVFIHFLRGVQGGFHMRPVEDLTAVDLEAREDLANLLEQGVELLRQSRKAPLGAGYQVPDLERENKVAGALGPRLYPFRGDKIPPGLVLKDLAGAEFDLSGAKGEVVLVNFWASWCRPCVEEIPSLSRLVERMKGRPFKVVAVNIGETAAEINRFMESIPVNFDILLDPNGHAVRDWKVYAYPSNFLIDREGRIQFAYRGALHWDAPSIVTTIEQLL